MLPITTLTAAFLASLYIALAFNVIGLRRRHHVSIGDAGHADLAMSIRAHGNLAEYLPICLILLGLAELNAAPPGVTGLFAVLIIAGRCMHAYAFLFDRERFQWRVRGMQLTFIAIGGLALYDAARALMTVFAG
jgi:hypothetical protein